jgi:hypothetical protein
MTLERFLIPRVPQMLWQPHILLNSRGRIQRKTWCMGPFAGVDYNLTLCRLLSRLQHIHHGQPHTWVDLNPIPESTLSPCQGLRIWPQSLLSAILFVEYRYNASLNLTSPSTSPTPPPDASLLWGSSWTTKKSLPSIVTSSEGGHPWIN